MFELPIRNAYDQIFMDEKIAARFLIDKNFVPHTITCDCGSDMTIKPSDNYKEAVCYECPRGRCHKRKSIKSPTVFGAYRIPLNLQFRILWWWTLGLSNYALINACEISEPTYIFFKGDILSKIKEEIDEHIVKIGGPGRIIQVDETAICRGRIITNPSDLDEHYGANTTWLVGGIEEGGAERIFLTIVPNRTKETLLAVLEKYVLPGTIIKTDGFASYPWAVERHCSIHIIVNHSEGFTNAEGDHTNNIENLWSHLKVEIRTRRGIMKVHIPTYIYEFQFRRLYLRRKNNDSYNSCFSNVIRLLIN